MSGMDLLKQEYDLYNNNNDIEYDELIISEIMQKVILSGLSKTDFFDNASFQGGTSLRLFHGLRRFSKDLDFQILDRSKNFEWGNYLEEIIKESNKYGCNFEIYDKWKRNSSIILAEVRDLSMARNIGLDFANKGKASKKAVVRIELDHNPPYNANTEWKNLEFPQGAKIKINDISTLFAGKTHALLCRDNGEFVKGRDWFDFLWYVNNSVKPNFDYLSNGLDRSGPWKDKKIQVNGNILGDMLKNKIESLDIKRVKEDVIRFLIPEDRLLIEKHLSKEVLLLNVDKLVKYTGELREENKNHIKRGYKR
jgi:hypothetical protein